MTTAEQVPAEPIAQGRIVATDVPLERFYEDYEGHYEWVGGDVVEIPPVFLECNNLQEYLGDLLKVYFEFRPIGKITKDPFPMHLEGISDRQPDIQVILGDNQQNLTSRYMNGAADTVIEIVSPSSAATDRGLKFEEYQRGGVPEYWIIDPQAKEVLFYRSDEKRVFKAQPVQEGIYTTEQLPGLQLHIPTLWQEELPSLLKIVQAVQTMLGD